MNRNLKAMGSVVLCAGLAACAAPQDAQELSQTTVQYTCGAGGNNTPLSVQYTFRGDEALAAKVVYSNQVVDLNRATTSNVDMVGNTFRGNGYTWTTDKFTKDDVGSANGSMLTQDAQQDLSGQPPTVSNVLVKDCRPVTAS